ncbi:PREDICTED: propionyl-CoA carboxylase alpha chain, mitochondrial-like [Amphimedon queenslandica]|uniref:Uncharacterized protein n=1 Tax=Amphimedon queenslandica TaxID=400682 RepID=A0A1X7VSV9_AMPQE|nr:PREDICTED: propionyl-CoA carboxylase alpha chain, mitochondrial-like [Amphimedon queenslandica]|eukprot:XP_019856559.1 PREDICTED: propionyl-CoA carboxylase alpha chain, mitochondrial-like [Amphimedon queenslandica]
MFSRSFVRGNFLRVPPRFRKAYCNGGNLKTFDKILIANRGEIACRVIRTCKEMGISCVSVFSDADAQALHVRMADEAVHIGPSVATQSYLNVDAILDAISLTGAQAVHPGYGFLSENKEFAKELAKRGVVFIGPNAHAIHVMGDKLESKRTATEAGVNIVPGYDGIVQDSTEAVKLAKEIGYPVMLKASAGGGGKGMRIAWDEKDVIDGFHLATEEAKTAVNDDRMLIEKFIEKPRHIEVQVLGDEHGNVVYLNERECSIQRRNQKVIEEAPSTFIDPVTRQSMGQQAVALAKSVQYNSAGTVEFLVDPQKNFYFLEMNTRLQVEHPITECITGVDLVKEMILSAAGHKLSFTQDDIGINGWAVEARIYAEDPVRFLPSVGYLSKYIEPSQAANEMIRVDTGIEEGSTISMFYDPMISKLVTHGKDRSTALTTLAKALDNYCIKGVTHNIPVVRDIISHPDFISGDISTNFIQEVYPNGFQGRKLDERGTEILIAAASFIHIKRTNAAPAFCNQNRQMKSAKDDGSKHILFLLIGGDSYKVEIEENHDTFFANINGKQIKILSEWQLGNAIVNLSVDDVKETIHFEDRKGQTMDLRLYGDKYSVQVLNSKQASMNEHVPQKSKDSLAHILKAPMPGIVKSIVCKEGDEVEKGVAIVTLEAMKMQNPLFAPLTGKVKTIYVKEGDSIAEDDLILELQV